MSCPPFGPATIAMYTLQELISQSVHPSWATLITNTTYMANWEAAWSAIARHVRVLSITVPVAVSVDILCEVANGADLVAA